MKRIFKHECVACGELSFEFHEQAHHCGVSYTWACAHCGADIRLCFGDDGASVSQVRTGKRHERTLALLQLRALPSLLFIHEGVAGNGDLSHKKDFYEEDTCPVNLLRCEEIVFEGNADPHSIFELVEERLITGPKAQSREEAHAELVEIAVRMSRTTSNLCDERTTNAYATSTRDDEWPIAPHTPCAQYAIRNRGRDFADAMCWAHRSAAHNLAKGEKYEIIVISDSTRAEGWVFLEWSAPPRHDAEDVFMVLEEMPEFAQARGSYLTELVPPKQLRCVAPFAALTGATHAEENSA